MSPSTEEKGKSARAKRATETRELTSKWTVPRQAGTRHFFPYTLIILDLLPHVGSSHTSHPS